MNDFDYDCYQKKQIARQAQHRKRGSKSKKCSLPSDNMTHKQWKERNGKVVEVAMNKPMGWEVFKQLSPETQEEYISGLQDTYFVKIADISGMFGITPRQLRKYVKDSGLQIVFPSGRRPADDGYSARWEEFLIGYTPPTEAPATPEVATKPQFDEVDVAAPPRDQPGLIDYTMEGVPMTQFSMEFSGGRTKDIADAMYRLFGDTVKGKLYISYTIE